MGLATPESKAKEAGAESGGSEAAAKRQKAQKRIKTPSEVTRPTGKRMEFVGRVTSPGGLDLKETRRGKLPSSLVEVIGIDLFHLVLAYGRDSNIMICH